MKNHCYSRLMKGVRQVLFFTSLPLSNPPPPNLHLVLCQTQDRRDLLRGVVLSEGLHDVSIEFVKMMLLGVSHRWCFRNFAKKWFLHFMHTYCHRFTLWLLMWRCPWQFCSNAPFVCWCGVVVFVCVCMCCFFPLPEHTGSHNWGRFCMCSHFPAPAWIHACAASSASQTTVNQL